jgi:hypothetical protein
MSATAVIAITTSTEGVAQAATPAPTAAKVAAEVRTAVAAHGQELAAATTKAGVQSGPSDEHTLTVGTADGKTVGLRLPATPGDAVGSVIGSQTVFRSTAEHFYLTADATADGARGAVSIQDALAPTRYIFGLDLPAGVSADLTPDGSVALRSRMNGVAIQLGEVAAPWAQDARGHAVPTHFEVNGSTITQVVDHRSAEVTYPRGCYQTKILPSDGRWVGIDPKNCQ